MTSSCQPIRVDDKNRDYGYLRIRLETEAVNLILSRVQSGQLDLMVSPAHHEEVEDPAAGAALALPTGRTTAIRQNVRQAPFGHEPFGHELRVE